MGKVGDPIKEGDPIHLRVDGEELGVLLLSRHGDMAHVRLAKRIPEGLFLGPQIVRVKLASLKEAVKRLEGKGDDG